MKSWSRLFLLGPLLVLLSCASSHSTQPYLRTGDPLLDAQTAAQSGPPRDKVLWEYRGAATAMRRGKFPEARSLLDDALLTTGSLPARDKNARRARSYFSGESKKTFIGEPYERVMAWYYRGILYWMDGELDNARACFRSAQLEDGDAENRSYASDYVLLDYLDGLITARLGADGSNSFTRAEKAAKLAIPPSYNPQANTFFFIEYGQGPTKFATGPYAEQLRFHPGSSAVREAIVRVEEQAAHVGPYDDLTFQATTRGGRVMDHILANKAVFKSSTDAAGDAALVSGFAVGAATRNDEAALGLVAAGLLTKIISGSATAAADIRCWNNLPQFLTFAALQLPPGPHTARIEFLDASRKVIPSLTQTVQLNLNAGRDAVVFLSQLKQ